MTKYKETKTIKANRDIGTIEKMITRGLIIDKGKAIDPTTEMIEITKADKDIMVIVDIIINMRGIIMMENLGTIIGIMIIDKTM